MPNVNGTGVDYDDLIVDDDQAAPVAHDYAFQPVLDGTMQRLAGNVLIRIRRDPKTEHQEHRGVSSSSETGLDEDLRTMNEASRAMLYSMRKGKAAPLAFKLHFETVSSASGRKAIYECWRIIPSRLRRFMRIRIDGIDAGTPHARLIEVARELRGELDRVGVLLPSLSYTLHLPKNLGLLGFVFDYKHLAAARSKSDAHVIAKSAILARDFALLQSAPVWIENITSLNAALIFQRAGVRYLSGPAVHTAQQMMAEANSFQLAGRSVETNAKTSQKF